MLINFENTCWNASQHSHFYDWPRCFPASIRETAPMCRGGRFSHQRLSFDRVSVDLSLDQWGWWWNFCLLNKGTQDKRVLSLLPSPCLLYFLDQGGMHPHFSAPFPLLFFGACGQKIFQPAHLRAWCFVFWSLVLIGIYLDTFFGSNWTSTEQYSTSNEIMSCNAYGICVILRFLQQLFILGFVYV